MTADKLPPCPLCGRPPKRATPRSIGPVAFCENDRCRLSQLTLREDEWRRLAAPAEEVERLKTELGNVCEMGARDAAALDAATRALREVVEYGPDRERTPNGWTCRYCGRTDGHNKVCVTNIAAAALAQIEGVKK